MLTLRHVVLMWSCHACQVPAPKNAPAPNMLPMFSPTLLPLLLFFRNALMLPGANRPLVFFFSSNWISLLYDTIAQLPDPLARNVEENPKLIECRIRKYL